MTVFTVALIVLAAAIIGAIVATTFKAVRAAFIVLLVLLLSTAVVYRCDAQSNTPQKAVEILLSSRSELNRTKVWSARGVPPIQSVSVGKPNDLLPGTVTYRVQQDIVHVAPVPELNIRFIK